MLKCITIELTANEIKSVELNRMGFVGRYDYKRCAANILNLTDNEIMISTENNFDNGNYVILPSQNAFNNWRFDDVATIYIKATSTGKVSVAVNEGW